MYYQYLITFSKTRDTMETFGKAKQSFPEVVLIPTPHQISKSCGLAIKFPCGILKEHKDFYDNLMVSSWLYILESVVDAKGVRYIVSANLVSGEIQ